MDRDGAAAIRAAPFFTLFSEKFIHTHLSYITDILDGRLGQRIFVCVPGLLFHDIFTGKIRTFVAEPVSVFSSLPAQNYTAASGAEFRFVVVRSAASGAGTVFSLGIGAKTAVEASGSDHIGSKHILISSFFSHSFPCMVKEIRNGFRNTAAAAVFRKPWTYDAVTFTCRDEYIFKPSLQSVSHLPES